jgi:hypothetical protein
VTSAEWLARLRHDLVKRLLWPARDRRDLGGDPQPGELVAALVDDDGTPVTPAALWAALRAEAPAGSPGAALDDFGVAVDDAVAAARAGDVAGVLNLEAAFAALAAALSPQRNA